MHEVSLAQGIAEAVYSSAKNADVERIASVRVAVGQLAGVDIDALRFAWVSLTREGLLKDAELVLERPQGTAWCMSCSETVPIAALGSPCPHCGGFQLITNGGHELKVLDFEAIDS